MKTMLSFVYGPVAGWIEAVRTHRLPSALQLLLPLTVLPLALLILGIRRRSWGYVAAGAIVWLFAGCCFTQGVAA